MTLDLDRDAARKQIALWWDQPKGKEGAIQREVLGCLFIVELTTALDRLDEAETLLRDCERHIQRRIGDPLTRRR